MALDERYMKNLSPIEIVVLELLVSGGEMYGLEMVRNSSRIKRGTIYVTLDRMTDKGLVKSRREKNPGDSGLPRRIYDLTGLGTRALQAQYAFQAVMTGPLAPEGSAA